MASQHKAEGQSIYGATEKDKSKIRAVSSVRAGGNFTSRLGMLKASSLRSSPNGKIKIDGETESNYQAESSRLSLGFLLCEGP